MPVCFNSVQHKVTSFHRFSVTSQESNKKLPETELNQKTCPTNTKERKDRNTRMMICQQGTINKEDAMELRENS